MTESSPPTLLGPGRRETLVLALAGVLTVAIRVLFPTVTPVVSADEGTWPLGVKLWTDSGQLTANFFTTPLYHLMVGIPFTLFESTLLVARIVSALFGLLNLYLTYRITERLFGDRRTAVWAALLLGTCYPAVLVDRKAFIEPIQISWMLGLVLCYLTAGRRALLGIAACTAGMLLTKANAVFLLPVLGLTSILSWRRSSLGNWQHLAALGVGVVLAAGGYWLAYLIDPQPFLAGWSQKLMLGAAPAPDTPVSDLAQTAKPQRPQALISFGRFRVSPLVWDTKMRELTASEPFLAVGGALAAVKAWWNRPARIITLWLAGGLLFFLVQGQLDNHLAVLYPVLAVGTAWILFDGTREAWRSGAAAMIFLLGAGRSAGNLVVSHEPTRPAIQWLTDRATVDQVVLAAPRILMMLPSKPASTFALGNRFVPTCASARAIRAKWIVFDDKEWMSYLKRAGVGVESVVDSLAPCATQVYQDRVVRILEVTGEKTQ